MRDHDDAIEFFRARGFPASRRVWSMGDTIVVPTGPAVRISHMALLKGAGFSHLANDDAVAAELGRSLPHDGLYFLPSPDFDANATDADNAALEARSAQAPRE